MDEVTTTTWRFLFGFYQPDEAVAIAKAQGIEFSPADEEQLRGRVYQAVSAVKNLPSRTGLSPELADVPAGSAAHLQKLSSESTFNEMTTGMKSWGWKNVELAKIRSFQPSVNWDYVRRLQEKVPAEADWEAVLKFCLPLAGSDAPHKLAVSFNQNTSTYSIVTEHLDFRVVGQVQGEDQNTKRKFFGFVTGFGLPTITVAHYRDLYLLKNGYHRAVALLANGHKRIPALVVETDSFQMTGAAGPGFFTVDVLSSAKPPMLSDFLSEPAVDILRTKLRTVVTIHGEAQALPL